MAEEKQLIIQTYKQYFEAFQALDPRAIVSYYHVPCVSISSGGVLVMTTGADVEAMFTRMMERLKRLGYARSELTDLRVTQLSDTIALLGIRGARYKEDGSVLEPLGATYTLRKTEGGWKMAVLTLHDPDIIVGSPA